MDFGNLSSFFQMIKGKSPKEFIMNMLGAQMPDNPIINNLINMANSGNKSGVEQVARNLMKEKGLDFDKEFASFMSNFNNKPR